MRKIKLQDEVKHNLENIKATKGVENAVLTQRDGNPIQYTGIWLSKDEIFSVSAATSAIYNCGLQLHGDELKYILIEGQKAKILISPLKNYGSPTLNRIIQAQNLENNNNEFYIAITTQPNVNLGGVLLKTRQSMIEIKKALILSGESFKPPLRHFSKEDIEKLLDNSNVKDSLSQSDKIDLFSMDITQNVYNKLNYILEDFSKQTLDLIRTYVTIEGGFIVANYENDKCAEPFIMDSEATMSYSLFSTANKCAWLLKKMQVKSILLECVNSFQFINKVGDGIFSTLVAKGRQKLGLLRLFIPKTCKDIDEILKEMNKKTEQNLTTLDFKQMFSELIF